VRREQKAYVRRDGCLRFGRASAPSCLIRGTLEYIISTTARELPRASAHLWWSLVRLLCFVVLRHGEAFGRKLDCVHAKRPVGRHGVVEAFVAFTPTDLPRWHTQIIEHYQSFAILSECHLDTIWSTAPSRRRKTRSQRTSFAPSVRARCRRSPTLPSVACGARTGRSGCRRRPSCR